MRTFHFIERFEPLAGKADEFRGEIMRVAEASRTEGGCLNMQVFESVRGPVIFAVHSVWVDENAFEHHCTRPHTVTFVSATEKLLTHPVAGLRLRTLSS